MITAGEFRRRARFEADRYGGDAWVFIRELLQNSRDAGARQVDLTTEQVDGRDRIVCRDDGDGMSFEHARDFLFTLYASSKRGRDDTAGRFGIGFWSVLRFFPHLVIVRSAPRGGASWELRLSGDLEHIERVETHLNRGTEVELQRPASGVDLDSAVWRAVQRDARFLGRRDADDRGLDIRVNTRIATRRLELPSPSLGFTTRDSRGVVALSDNPQVDLLAHGLRVRTAATMDELLMETDRRRKPAPTIPDGLVPRVILDSRRLQVLMARGDARTDRELRRLVSLGRRALRRLVRDQLDREAGLGRMGRWAMRIRELVSPPWSRPVRWITAVAIVTAVVAAGLALVGRAHRDPPAFPEITGVTSPLAFPYDPASVLAADLAGRYAGPAADVLDPQPVEVAISYRPATAEPMLGLFRVTGLDDDGATVAQADGDHLGEFSGRPCDESCLTIEILIRTGGGRVRLPVPSGHVLDPVSVRIDGGAIELRTAGDGGPVLVFGGDFDGRVSYRTGPGVETTTARSGPWPALPVEVEVFARELSRVTAEEAARRARDWVGRRVAYDTSPSTVARHRDAAALETGFVERSLMVGAGDCDVQNALVADILSKAGFAARLAIGWVGADGRALPGLHAWVEYRGSTGIWRIVDASVGGGPGIASIDRTTATSSRVAALPDPPNPNSGTQIPGPREIGIDEWAMIAALLLATGMVVVYRRRVKVRPEHGESEPDLAGLLRGALTRPEAYGEVPSLFSRRIVPVLGGRNVSLQRARSLARRDRLAMTLNAAGLARRATAAGQPVVDAGRPEGAAVALALGAVDLDHWDRILDGGETHPATRRLERAARAVGETWRVVVHLGLFDDVSVLDGRVAGLGNRCRVVAIDGDGEFWPSVRKLAERQPAAAALLVAEKVLERIPSSSEWRHRVLSPLSIEAVTEQAERST